jgi:acyl carrier protein
MITEKELISLVANTLGVDEALLSLDTSNSDLDEWDSLGHIALLQEIDKSFEGRYTPSGKLASSISIRELLDALNSRE